jgi:hypothetical protein
VLSPIPRKPGRRKENAVVAAATASTSESSFPFTLQDPAAAMVLLYHLRSQTKDICKSAYYAGTYSVNEAAQVKMHNHVVSSVSTELSGLAGARGDALKAIMNAGQSIVPAARNRVPCVPILSGNATISPEARSSARLARKIPVSRPLTLAHVPSVIIRPALGSAAQ